MKSLRISKKYFTKKLALVFKITFFLTFVCFITLFVWFKVRAKSNLLENQIILKNSKRKPNKIVSLYLTKGRSQESISTNFDVDIYKPLFFSIKNVSASNAFPHIILNNKDWFSNKGIIESIFYGQDIDSLSNQEKTIELTKYISGNIYHYDPPFYSKSELSSPVNFFNLFGYGFCSDFSYTLVVLANLVEIESRIVNLEEPHMTAEVYYENSWHMYDVDNRIYLTKENGEVASINDIFQDLSLINQVENKFSQPLTRDFYYRVFSNNKINEVVNAKEHIDKIQNEIEYKLRPNEEIRFYYNWKGDRFWSDFNQEPPIYTNGILISDFKSNSLNNSIEIILPYPILKSYIYTKHLCQFAKDIWFSSNLEDDVVEKNWVSLNDFCSQDVIVLTDIFPKGENSLITYKYSLKFPKIIDKNYLIYTQFQVAPNSIPKLKKGDNIIEERSGNSDKLKIKFAFTKK
ncbi:transglutaminase domain-containing protein [Patescibacteria group bacterium]